MTRPLASQRADVAVDLTTPSLPRWFSVVAGAVAVVSAAAAWHWGAHWLTGGILAAAIYSGTVTAASWRWEGRRRATDRLARTVLAGGLIAAIAPLVFIVTFIVVQGAPALTGDFLTHSMNGVTGDQPGGGAYHALIGTIQQVGIAAVIALPLGILTAIYLVEFGRGRFAQAVTFFVDVMNGVPSIVAGLFVYSFLLLGTGLRPFGAAGSMALVILMLPIVVRSAETMLALVPAELREAAYALGIPTWRTVLRIVVPTAMSGLISGSLMAISRVAGETAPLILLVGYSSAINTNPLSGDQASLPVLIWDQLGKRSGNTGEFAEPRAWAAALVLIALILAINLAARGLARLARTR